MILRRNYCKELGIFLAHFLWWLGFDYRDREWDDLECSIRKRTVTKWFTMDSPWNRGCVESPTLGVNVYCFRMLHSRSSHSLSR